jgi:DNA-binding LacI/PurR family transcriptional regulator
MADIARLAGVHMSTVSRALGGSPLVNAETRDRIVELARSLNYSVNVGAQNLRLKQNRTVAVVVPFDPVSREHLSDPFFLGLIGSIGDALTDSGHDMLLSRVDAEHLDRAAHLVDAGRAMGVILIGQWHHHDQLNEMTMRGVPFVVWGGRLPDQLYPTVGSDNAEGGRLATEHLLSRGARRIVFLGDTSLPEVALRYQGYVAAHRAQGVDVRPDLLCKVPFVPDLIAPQIEALVVGGTAFDAIVAGSDVLAMGAINALRRLGRVVPDDVAVVGYDDILLAAHFHPTLTTIRQPLQASGAALVKTLLEHTAGHRPPAVLLPTELVVRDSSTRQVQRSTGGGSRTSGR